MKMHKIKKYVYFLTSIKMIKISPEKYEQNGIEILFNNFGRLWLNEKHIENTIAHSALQNITRKYPSKYRKQRQELVSCDNYQSCRIFLKQKLAIKIMDC